MCGIIGYIGNQNAQKIIINSLKRLEYRGYDSVGLATFEGNKVEFIIYALEESIRISIFKPPICNMKFSR